MTEITVIREQGALLDMAPYIESIARQAGLEEPVKVKLGEERLRVWPDRVELKRDGAWMEIPFADAPLEGSGEEAAGHE